MADPHAPDDLLHFGVHLTLDGYGGARQRLADLATVRGCLSELPELLGMHKLRRRPCSRSAILATRTRAGSAATC